MPKPSAARARRMERKNKRRASSSGASPPGKINAVDGIVHHESLDLLYRAMMQWQQVVTTDRREAAQRAEEDRLDFSAEERAVIDQDRQRYEVARKNKLEDIGMDLASFLQFSLTNLADAAVRCRLANAGDVNAMMSALVEAIAKSHMTYQVALLLCGGAKAIREAQLLPPHVADNANTPLHEVVVGIIKEALVPPLVQLLSDALATFAATITIDEELIDAAASLGAPPPLPFSNASGIVAAYVDVLRKTEIASRLCGST